MVKAVFLAAPGAVHALGGEDLVECCTVPAVPVSDQETVPAGTLAEVHDEGAGLLDGPGVIRIGGDRPSEWTSGVLSGEASDPRINLEDRRFVQRHGIDLMPSAAA